MVARNDQTEDGVEQINEAVDDGSGCAEVWEELSELRDEQNRSRSSGTDRRSFFHSTLGALGGLAGLNGIVGKAKGALPGRSEADSSGLSERPEGVSATDAPVRRGRVMRSSKVQSVLSEVKGMGVRAGTADAYRLTLGGRRITVTTIETKRGTLRHMVSDRGEEDVHFFYASDGPSASSRFDTPDGTQGVLVGKEDGVEFLRSVTDSEEETAARRLGVPTDRIIAHQSSDSEGVQAIVIDKSNREVSRYEVGSEVKELDVALPSGPRSGEVSIQDTCDAAAIFCYLCVEGAAICGLCVSMCASGVGTLGCVLCLIHTCGVTSADCYSCVDCLS